MLCCKLCGQRLIPASLADRLMGGLAAWFGRAFRHEKLFSKCKAVIVFPKLVLGLDGQPSDLEAP